MGERPGLQVRPVGPADAPGIFALYSSPQVCRYFDLAPFTEPAQAKAHLDGWLAGAAGRRQFRWVLDVEGAFAGTLGLYGIYWHQKRACLGFDLMPAFWGRGLMAAALGRMLPLWRREFGLHRLQALVMPENTASRRLLETQGFLREGLLRDYEEWEGKGFVDLEMWARIL